MTLVVTFSMQGQPEQSIELTQSPVMIGSLLSNQLILSGPGIEPIHALLERKSETEWVLTDLGSESGVQVNGKSIDVEQKVSAGDSVTIGSVNLSLGLPTSPGPDLPPAPPEMKLKTPAPPPPDAKPKASPPKKEVQGDAKKASANQAPAKKALPKHSSECPHESFRNVATALSLEHQHHQASLRDVSGNCATNQRRNVCYITVAGVAAIR